MDIEQLDREIIYRTSRSSGAGGQHVNKVSTRVELLFDVVNSELLTDPEKMLVMERLQSRITKAGILILRCDATRSQAENKAIVYQRFLDLLQAAVRPQKKRKKTRPTAASKQRRLDEKRKVAQKKESRKFNPGEQL